MRTIGRPTWGNMALVCATLLVPGCRWGYQILSDEVDRRGDVGGAASSDGGADGNSAGGQGSAASASTGGASTGGASGGTGTGGAGTGGAGTGGSGGLPGGPYNLAFVSSTLASSDLGSLAAYDSRCNSLATAASLPGADGTNFIAWMSSSSEDALNRIFGTRGWVMVDGTPFADRLGPQSDVFNNIDQDENGNSVSGTIATGTNDDGTFAGVSCSDWTNATAGSTLRIGYTDGGPTAYTDSVTSSCSTLNHTLCLMLEYSNPLTPPPFSGKAIYVTASRFVPGSDPDALCEAEKPAGAGSVRALLARTTAAAQDVLDPGQLYVRPDGVEVGLGSEISARNLRSGLWQRGNGTYARASIGDVWTGQADLTQLGTVNSTCDDWRSTASASGRYGSMNRLSQFFSDATGGCNFSRWLYCVEQ